MWTIPLHTTFIYGPQKNEINHTIANCHLEEIEQNAYIFYIIMYTLCVSKLFTHVFIMKIFLKISVGLPK